MGRSKKTAAPRIALMVTLPSPCFNDDLTKDSRGLHASMLTISASAVSVNQRGNLIARARTGCIR